LKTNWELRAGVIGLGVGEKHIAGYQADERCQVVLLCDTDSAKLSQVGSRYPEITRINDPEEVLTNPDIGVVSIASYDNFHCDQIVLALEHGKHVFVEKPLCLMQEELDDIIGELRCNPDLKLSSNLILRKTPRFVELRERLQCGALGVPYYWEGDYDYGRLHKITEGWRGQIPNYSVVHGGAIHLLDLIWWLSGKKVLRVHSIGNNLATENTKYKRQSLVTTILDLDDGSTAKVSANFASVVPHHHKLSVYGTEGTFEQSHLGAAYFWSRDPQSSPELVKSTYPGTAKGDMLPSFVKSILDGNEPEVSAQEVVDVMSVSLAIEESLQSQKPVNVNYQSIYN